MNTLFTLNAASARTTPLSHSLPAPVPAPVPVPGPDSSITQKLPSFPPRCLEDSGGGLVAPHEGCPAFQWYGATDRGRRRENNEDTWLVEENCGMFAVCDGMGGHAAGEQASFLARAEISRAISNHELANCKDNSEVTFLLDSIFQRISDLMNEAGNLHPDWHGMGSTVVLALLRQGYLHIANIGDSRAYLMREGQIYQLTHDHSVAGRIVRQGRMEASQVRSHFQRNQLTMALGSQAPVSAFHSMVKLQAQDTLLLCSDGLWEILLEHEITAILQANAPLENLVRLLVTAANAAGGHDNITALVARFGQMPELTI